MLQFSEGMRVRRVNDPGKVGTATGKRQARINSTSIEVILPDGFKAWWPEHHTEAAPLKADRRDALESGRYGRVEDLRRALMVEKIRGDLTDVFYSMGASDTDFYPHQFKPVLRFIESVTGRLLLRMKSASARPSRLFSSGRNWSSRAGAPPADCLPLDASGEVAR